MAHPLAFREIPDEMGHFSRSGVNPLSHLARLSSTASTIFPLSFGGWVHLLELLILLRPAESKRFPLGTGVEVYDEHIGLAPGSWKLSSEVILGSATFPSRHIVDTANPLNDTRFVKRGPSLLMLNTKESTLVHDQQGTKTLTDGDSGSSSVLSLI